jgi:coenzyme F420-dependent glucose-6-phosphate dehydrogenase
MVEIGYSLSSEEHAPLDMVRWAELAEQAGFGYALISDHYHPWTNQQGHAGFVWGMLGAISQRTERLVVGTGVTCPTMRLNPAIVAQAAATAATLMPGRFFLGVGSGENHNEHILGDKWPPTDIRLEMLEEAVAVMRQLWEGGTQSFYGDYYVVENAQVYDLPDQPVEVMVAASGQKAAQLAARIGDGLISTSPQREVVEAFNDKGNDDRPKYGQMTVCWADTMDKAVETALKYWPNAGVPGELSQELATPKHFEQASQNVTADQIKQAVVCGPDVGPIRDKIKAYEEAGFTHVYLHQVGPDQENFLTFAEQELLPALRPLAMASVS